MGQFEVKFFPQMAIKRQALADFITEFTYSNTAEVTGTTNSTETAKAIGVRERERESFVPMEGDAE